MGSSLVHLMPAAKYCMGAKVPVTGRRAKMQLTVTVYKERRNT